MLIWLYLSKQQIDSIEVIRKSFKEISNQQINKTENIKYLNKRTIRKKLHQRELEWQECQKFSNTDKNKMKKRFPSVIGIGVMKCGTGGTIEFLKQHPLVKLPNASEYEVFILNDAGKPNMKRYRRFFPFLKLNEITAEKNPEYFDGLPINLPAIVHKYLPKVKIMLNVCDPVDRAFSNFVHRNLNKQFEFHQYKTFDEFVEKFLPAAKKMMESFNSYRLDDLSTEKKLNKVYEMTFPEMQIHVLTKGLYYYHMLRWLKSFDRSKILIIDGEEFLTNPGKVMEDLQDFIGIPRLLLKEDFVKNNKTNFYCYRKMEERHLSNSELDDDQVGWFCLGKDKGRTRNNVRRAFNKSMELLTKFYEPYNKKFFELLGRNFNWKKLP